MSWFRRNLRHGSSLALLALAINFLLSFGHIHLPVAPSDHSPIKLIATNAHGATGSTDNDTGGHPDDFCPICAALATIATGAVADPPALPIDFASSRINRPIEVARHVVQSPRASYHSRGPPSLLTLLV